MIEYNRIDFIYSFVESWWGMYSTLLLQSVAILALAWIVTSLLRNLSASQRHIIWAVSLVFIIALPFIPNVFPAWSPPTVNLTNTLMEENLSPIAPEPLIQDHTVAQNNSSPPIKNKVDKDVMLNETSLTKLSPASMAMQFEESAPVPGKLPLSFCLMAAWIIAVFTCLIPVLTGLLRLISLRKHMYAPNNAHMIEEFLSIKQSLNIRRNVTLRIADEDSRCRLPMTWGFIRPMLLLPANSIEWPISQLRVVLSHEMAHIKRGDWLIYMFARLCGCLLWSNPLVWLAVHKIRVESEQACDDSVLRNGSAPAVYAHHLLQVVRSMKHAPNPSAVSMARSSKLESRVRAILDPKRSRKTWTRTGVAVVLLASLIFSLPITGLQWSDASGQVEENKEDTRETISSEQNSSAISNNSFNKTNTSISESVVEGKYDPENGKPQLRFLSWQAPKDERVYWKPDGDIIKDEEDLSIIRHFPATSMSAGSHPEYRYLQLWFSHPNFDQQTIADITIYNIIMIKKL